MRDILTAKHIAMILISLLLVTALVLGRAKLKFFMEFLLNPTKIGSITPSSKALAKGMVNQIERRVDVCIELGAGTGPVTSEIKKSTERCIVHC